MDQALTAQEQVAEGGTGAGRASASGASDGVNGNKPQRARKCWRRTRGGSASMHFIFEIELGVLYVLCRLSRGLAPKSLACNRGQWSRKDRGAR
jgi:hypothetical protein